MTGFVSTWYNTTAFTTVTTVAATLAVGILGAVIAWKVRFPRRRLTYSLSTAAPLLATPHGVNSQLEVRHSGTSVKDPYIVEVRVAGGGRLDIPSNAFDSGKPLRFDLAAPIVTVIQTTSAPPTAPVPEFEIVDAPEKIVAPAALELMRATSQPLEIPSVISVPPCRIGRRQTITITVITDGSPTLTCESPLVDVDIVEITESADGERSRLKVSAVFFVVGSMVGGLFNYLTSTLDR